MRPALFVVALSLVTPAMAVAQVRGGGGRSSTPPPVSSPRGPVTVRGTSSGPVRPGPPGQFNSRLVFKPNAFFAGRRPNVLWFGYWGFYAGWEPWTQGDALPADAPLVPTPELPTGGLQLDVEPRRTLVYVDGIYAGVAGDFSGYYHHLELTAGPHRVDLISKGYLPQTVGIVVTPGQTQTYRSALSWTTSGQR
jgi:hypothetical protein